MSTDGEQAQREMLKAQAGNLMAEVVALLTELVDSYPDQRASAIHPKAGFSSTIQQIERIRKAIRSAKV